MKNLSLGHHEIQVLKYLYKQGSSYFNDIKKYVLGHPQRAKRVISKLERLGLIESVYEPLVLPNGKVMVMMRIIRLTPKGYDIAKNIV